ncbi:MAG: hypothetical protein Q8M73_06235 [Actinomycetota bacterium]|nr:hypothetical protein [Actinomycetota bacterium]
MSEAIEQRIQVALDHMDGWLPGSTAGPKHPVFEWIAQDRAANRLDNFTASGIESLAEMTTTLDFVDPPIAGIASVRHRLRIASDENELWNIRLELAVARMLVLAGVAFRFGGPPNPEPDFVVEGAGLGIEVTRRDYDGVDDLVQVLSHLVDSLPLIVTLTFDNYPLQIRQAKRREIMTLIADAIAKGERIETIHEIDTFTGPFVLTVDVSDASDMGEDSKVRVEVESPALARTMEQVELAILSKTRDAQKLEQARSMPTIIVVESSDVGYAWMRSMATWEAVLRTWMTPEFPFLGIGLVQRNILVPGLGYAFVLNPHADASALARGATVLAQIAANYSP